MLELFSKIDPLAQALIILYAGGALCAIAVIAICDIVKRMKK
jgi:hypothetical protein